MSGRELAGNSPEVDEYPLHLAFFGANRFHLVLSFSPGIAEIWRVNEVFWAHTYGGHDPIFCVYRNTPAPQL